MSSDFEFARIFDPSLPPSPPPPCFLPLNPPPPSLHPLPNLPTCPDSLTRRLLVRSVSRFNTLPKVLQLADRLFRDAPPVIVAIRDQLWPIQDDLKVTHAQNFILEKLLGSLRSEIAGRRMMRQLENLVTVIDLTFLIANDKDDEGRQWSKFQLTGFDAAGTSKISLLNLGRHLDHFLPEDQRSCYSIMGEVVDEQSETGDTARVFLRVAKIAAEEEEEEKAPVVDGDDREEKTRRRLLEAPAMYLVYKTHEPFFLSDLADPDPVVCGALCSSLQCAGYVPHVPLPPYDSTHHLDEILNGCLQKQAKVVSQQSRESKGLKKSPKHTKPAQDTKVVAPTNGLQVNLVEDVKDRDSSNGVEYTQVLSDQAIIVDQFCHNWQETNPASQLFIPKSEMSFTLQDCLDSLQMVVDKEEDMVAGVNLMKTEKDYAESNGQTAEDNRRMDLKADRELKQETFAEVVVNTETKVEFQAHQRVTKVKPSFLPACPLPSQTVPRFQCALCNQSYSRRWSLKHHVENVHKTQSLPPLGYEAELQQKVGQQKFPAIQKEDATNYRLGLTEPDSVKKRPMKCSSNSSSKKSFHCGGECDYVSSSVWNLKVHRDTVHLKRKNYSCSKCAYASANSSNVKKHERTMHLAPTEESGRKRKRKARRNDSKVKDDTLIALL